MSPERILLRHTLAALAYRTQKALRDCPPGGGDLRVGVYVRSFMAEISRHPDCLRWPTRWPVFTTRSSSFRTIWQTRRLPTRSFCRDRCPTR